MVYRTHIRTVAHMFHEGDDKENLDCVEELHEICDEQGRTIAYIVDIKTAQIFCDMLNKAQA